MGKGSCCGAPSGAGRLARKIGYRAGDLGSLPKGANLGLSCGNPTALASLRKGEVVLDLGAGGGLDVFIAARRVGPRGRAVGVDMTPEMIARARRAAGSYRRRTGWDNVEFRLGEIEHLPAADASVDVVISNCVLNLSPVKPQVWREIARVLRPGGREAVSDIVLRRPLPAALGRSGKALCGCIAGAATVEQTVRMMRKAGLSSVRVTPVPGIVEEIYRGDGARKLLPKGRVLSDFIAGAAVSAIKPR